MTAEEVEGLFREHGGLLSGHFQLSSDLHSPHYFQSALVLRHPRLAQELGRALASRILEVGGDGAAGVVAPALGGLIIGHEVARALDVPFQFAERQEGRMAFRRGFQVDPGQPVVLVEDVVTTGDSILQVASLVREARGEMLAGGCLVDRSGEAPHLGVPLVSLLRYPVVNYRSEECPLCRKGKPIEKPGSR